MPQAGLFKFSVDNMTPEMRPSARYILMVLYGIMTLAFFIAVIAYGAVNSVPLISRETPIQTAFVPTKYTPLDFPAITVCPTDKDAVVSAEKCALEEGSGIQSNDCLSSVTTVTVRIQGYDYTCLQYNGPTQADPLQSSTTSSCFITRTAIDTNNTKDNDPTGAFVIAHSQGVTPTLGFYNSFVATPGYMQLVMLRNMTTLRTDGSVYAEFQVSASKAPLKNADPAIQEIDVHVIYPDQTSYVGVEEYSALVQLQKGRFIVEAGGLAALLLFLHRIVMWIVTFPMYFCCRTAEAKAAGGDATL